MKRRNGLKNELSDEVTVSWIWRVDHLRGFGIWREGPIHAIFNALVDDCKKEL